MFAMLIRLIQKKRNKLVKKREYWAWVALSVKH